MGKLAKYDIIFLCLKQKQWKQDALRLLTV